MTDAPRNDAPADARARWHRRRAVLAGLAVIVVAAVAAAALAMGDGDRGAAAGDRSAAATAAAGTADPGNAAPPPPLAPPADPDVEPVAADQLPPALPPAPLDEPVVLEGTTVGVPEIEAIEAQARGRGSIAGPALRVTVRLDNGTAAPLSLDDAAVTLAFGDDATPAPPVEDGSAAPFAGTLEPGAAADGVYVFRVPEDQRGAVTVQVAVRPGSSVVTFAGALD